MQETAKGEQTRDRILKETRKLLVTRGFHNTSISEIIKATGVKKGNLYYYFGSKEELSLAVLEDAAAEFFGLISRAFRGETALARIDSFLAAVVEQQRSANFVGGCLFGNTALEMSDSNPAFARIIQQVFEQWTAMLETHIRQAQQEGDLGQQLSAGQLARLMVAAIEGGIMMARVSKNEADLVDCLAALKQLAG